MGVGYTQDLTLDYRLRLWALKSASRAVSAVAELLVLFTLPIELALDISVVVGCRPSFTF